jgi:hypothetical protein
MEGSQSGQAKILKVVEKNWLSSEWKSKIQWLIAEQVFDDSFLTLAYKKRGEKALEMARGFQKKDVLCMWILGELLPVKKESLYVLNYLHYRLNPTFANFENKMLQQKVNTLTYAINNLDGQELIQAGSYRYHALKIAKELEFKVLKLDELQHEKVSGKLLRMYTEARAERNNYKSMLNKSLHVIYENRFTKGMLHKMMEMLETVKIRWSYIAPYLFTRRNKRVKRNGNMFKNALNKLGKYIKDKHSGFILQEELTMLESMNLKEQGLQWSGIAATIIYKDEKLKKIYEKLDLNAKYQGMKMILAGTQELETIQEIRLKIKSNIKENMKLLSSTSSTSSLPNINLSAIQNDEEEWEEMEEEEDLNQTNHSRTRKLMQAFK